MVADLHTNICTAEVKKSEFQHACPLKIHYSSKVKVAVCITVINKWVFLFIGACLVVSVAKSKKEKANF